MKVKDIYTSDVTTLREDSTVADAIQLLEKKQFNGVIIVDTKNQYKGILSLQDITAALVPHEFEANTQLARAMSNEGFFSRVCQELKDAQVSTLMRTDLLTVSPDDDLMAITADFLKHDLYIVPVIENGQLVGIITRSEIKHAIAKSMGVHPILK